MKKLIYCVLALVLFGCQTSKLKVFDLHKETTPDIAHRFKNVYFKDFNNSFKSIEGKWCWGNGQDTLIVEIKSILKNRMPSFEGKYIKSYYLDMAVIKGVRYVKNNKVIIDNLDSLNTNLKMHIYNASYNTDRFNAICCYKEKVGSRYAYLRKHFEEYIEVTSYTLGDWIFYENKDYKIVIPRNILMKRIKKPKLFN